MIRSLPVLIFILFSISAKGQWDENDYLSKDFHLKKRNALRALMPEKSAAVFFANPVRNRSNDVDFEYSQDPDFYYLSGYKEPNAVLILFKEPRTLDGKLVNELIFVQERNAKAEIWTGKRLGVDGTIKRCGIEAVYNGIDFKGFGINWSTFNEIFVLYPDQPNSSRSEQADLADLVNYFNESVSSSSDKLNTSGLQKYMAGLREKKDPEELVLLQKAMDISIIGFKDMIRQLAPGMSEFEAQAIVEYHAKKGGSEYMGYPSICGGGNNACVLHYTFNRKKLEAGEMVLIDMGAEYHGYTADITRTLPVDGKFSPEEAAIYSLVLAAADSGINSCINGNDFRAAHRAATDIVARGLLALGIINNADQVGKYFMHGTSHYLGLNVHDPGTYAPLSPGVVMTVEPGIYIPDGSPCDRKWWGIGVRIEDDILVTDDHPVNMTAALPRTIPELEKMMAEDF